MPLRPLNREQAWILPPSLEELVPADHPSRFVAEFVDTLGREDWAELGVQIDGEALGAPAYHPRALLCIWLYGFMTGVRSSRNLEAACRDQVPYFWLAGASAPTTTRCGGSMPDTATRCGSCSSARCGLR